MDDKNLTDIEKLNQAANKENKRENRREVIRYILCFLIAAVVIVVIRIFIGPCIVVGDSMNPTYHDGQRVLTYNKIFKPIDVGEVVTLKNEFTDGDCFVKRVVGIPGDELVIIDGILYRNGEEAINFEPIEDPGMLEEPCIVQKNEYFCMGDNRNNSYDSRMIGPVKYDDILYVIFNSKID